MMESLAANNCSLHSAVLVSSSECTVASIIHFLFISKTQGGDTNAKVKKVVVTSSLIVFILDRETHTNLFPNQTQEINLLHNLPMYGTLNQITIWYFLTTFLT